MSAWTKRVNVGEHGGRSQESPHALPGTDDDGIAGSDLGRREAADARDSNHATGAEGSPALVDVSCRTPSVRTSSDTGRRAQSNHRTIRPRRTTGRIG